MVAQKNRKTADVVDVFMGYENSRKGIRIDSAGFKSGCNSAAAYSEINKNPFPGSADEARIAGTAAGYGKKLCQKNNPPDNIISGAETAPLSEIF